MADDTLSYIDLQSVGHNQGRSCSFGVKVHLVHLDLDVLHRRVRYGASHRAKQPRFYDHTHHIEHLIKNVEEGYCWFDEFSRERLDCAYDYTFKLLDIMLERYPNASAVIDNLEFQDIDWKNRNNGMPGLIRIPVTLEKYVEACETFDTRMICAALLADRPDAVRVMMEKSAKYYQKEKKKFSKNSFKDSHDAKRDASYELAVEELKALENIADEVLRHNQVPW